jgi:hypothetical protein
MRTNYSITILLLLFLLSIRSVVFAQDEVVYYYACIIDNDHKNLYISSIEEAVFMEYFDYKTDEYLPGEIEMQYKDYVESEFNKFVFSVEDEFTYKMTPDETEIEDSFLKMIEKYENEGFKIKTVKGFYYD